MNHTTPLLAACGLAFALAACDGQATRENLAQAGQKTQEAVSEASGKLQPKLERAGEKIADATEKAAANVRETVNAARRDDGEARPGNGPTASATAGTGTKTTVTTGERTSVSTSGISPETRAKLGDAAVVASIKADFLKDPDLSVLGINVDYDGGVVTLKGQADNEQARERAGKIAASVKGVREVRNQLTVKTG